MERDTMTVDIYIIYNIYIFIIYIYIYIYIYIKKENLKRVSKGHP